MTNRHKIPPLHAPNDPVLQPQRISDGLRVVLEEVHVEMELQDWLLFHLGGDG